MKKAKSELNDWPRDEYQRSDFGEIVRGKYAKRAAHATNVVVLEPEIAKIFTTDAAVNEALSGLIDVARSTARLTSRSTAPREKAVRAR